MTFKLSNFYTMKFQCIEIIFFKIIKIIDDSGGVRTHEATACDLKSHPFDHSGTLSWFFLKMI